MSVEARVKAALDVFGDPVEKSELYAAGDAARYYTFTCSSFGDNFGDDEPGCERCLVSVHLFAPLTENCIRRRGETKRALFAAGFTWPQCTDATDQDGQHYQGTQDAPCMIVLRNLSDTDVRTVTITAIKRSV